MKHENAYSHLLTRCDLSQRWRTSRENFEAAREARHSAFFEAGAPGSATGLATSEQIENEALVVPLK